MGKRLPFLAALSGPLAVEQLNLLLLDQQVANLNLRRDDPRFSHLRDTLAVSTGDWVDLAVQNGPKGKGKVIKEIDGSITLDITWLPVHPPDCYPISLVVGLARPQTCRKILEQATAQGVCSFSFFEADKGEASYAQSRLWTSDEWKRKIEAGVAQSFSSSVPGCSLFSNLGEALEQEKKKRATGIALDNYEATGSLHAHLKGRSKEYVLCLGAERGWSDRERNLLRKYGYSLLHLGPRVLRVETAVVAALGVISGSFYS